MWISMLVTVVGWVISTSWAVTWCNFRLKRVFHHFASKLVYFVVGLRGQDRISQLSSGEKTYRHYFSTVSKSYRLKETLTVETGSMKPMIETLWYPSLNLIFLSESKGFLLDRIPCLSHVFNKFIACLSSLFFRPTDYELVKTWKVVSGDTTAGWRTVTIIIW